MGTLIKEFAKMLSSWISASYQRIHADLQKKPVVTLITLLLLVCFVIGGSYLGAAIYSEINKENAQVIFERGDDDGAEQPVRSSAPSPGG